jgi:hypothetical protein
MIPWRLQLRTSGDHLNILPTPKNTSEYTWARGVKFTLFSGFVSIYILIGLCTAKTPNHLRWVSKESAPFLPRWFWSFYWDKLFLAVTIFLISYNILYNQNPTVPLLTKNSTSPSTLPHPQTRHRQWHSQPNLFPLSSTSSPRPGTDSHIDNIICFWLAVRGKTVFNSADSFSIKP